MKLERQSDVSPCGKAAGYDDLPGELIKLDSDDIERVFCKLCNLIVDTGEWPEDWRRSVFVTIPKVKGAVRCEDHRMIALISHASKMLLRILLNRMKFAAEEQIADVQMGFRQGVGKTDQIFNLRIIMPDQRKVVSPTFLVLLSGHLTSRSPASGMFHHCSSKSNRVGAPVKLSERVLNVHTLKPCFLNRTRDLDELQGFCWMTTLEALLLPLPAAPLEVPTEHLGAAFTTLLWFQTDFIMAGCWKLLVF